MRKTGMNLVFFGVFFLSCRITSSLPPVLEHRVSITEGSEESYLTFDEMVHRLMDADVVFVGEIHDDSLTHIVEYELLRRVFRHHRNLGVALEMFERDVQKALDDYLSARITEKEFLAVSRPWGNYESAHRPLVEFARENCLPVLAMNVPRRYANRVAVMGEEGLAALADSEKVWIARELKPLDDEYRKRFMEQMGESRPGPMARFDPENLYKAQCIKDDTMAESILMFREDRPGVKVISYQGDFHSAFGLGVVKKLNLLDLSVKTVVVSIVPVEDLSEVDFASFRERGDFLIFVQKITQE